MEQIHHNYNHRKKFLPKEARLFLERVFEKKQSLNSKEREAIAKKCGLTPLQVRVWVCILCVTIANLTSLLTKKTYVVHK